MWGVGWWQWRCLGEEVDRGLRENFGEDGEGKREHKSGGGGEAGEEVVLEGESGQHNEPERRRQQRPEAAAAATWNGESRG